MPIAATRSTGSSWRRANSSSCTGCSAPTTPGEIIRRDFLQLSFPPRWKYNILKALDYFRAAGVPWDPRMADALAFLLSRRLPDGRWRLNAPHPGQVHFVMEQAGQPSRWNTLLALRVLKAYGQGKG